MNLLKKPLKRKGPLLVIIMDGVGIGKENDGNAVYKANTVMLDELKEKSLYRTLYAHGPYVGLPSDGDMGNSEVGHNALGSGKIYPQGAKLVNKSIQSGQIFTGETWKQVTENVKNKNSVLHFIGLLSDGNVHSHIEQLKKMISQAADDGVKEIRIHALLDGRDVGETSAPQYIKDIEDFSTTLKSKGCSCKIASVGGRMVITMDRYEADWDMVRKGWEVQVEGKGRMFENAIKGYETLREETGKTDQFFDPYVIGQDGEAIGTISDGDSVIFFNFRGDRSIEVSKAFEEKDFDKFEKQKNPDVFYAGMMEYDSDLKIPKNYLVSPPRISHTLGEYLTREKITMFALSETQKYGHVTYFWNGNKSGKFDENLETYIEIPSDNVPFEQRPWMKCAEITDKAIELLKSGTYKFGRINFPNGDMVGHTGDFQAAQCSMEGLDLSIKRLLKVIKQAGGTAIITADHGNADEMYMISKKTGDFQINEKTGKPIAKTSHTLNKVPFIIYDPEYKGEYSLKEDEEYGIANITATIMNFLGYEAPEDYEPSLIKFK